MIPGRQYSFGDYFSMAWRHRWLIAIPLVTAGVGAAVATAVFPLGAAARSELYLAVLVTGLALGLMLTAALEYRDSTFRTQDDVMAALDVSVLAVVPGMLTRRERIHRGRRRRMVRLIAVSAVLVALSLVALVVWR